MEHLLQHQRVDHIPAGHQRRLENPGIPELVMIEVQSGEYLGKDDIIRFEDHCLNTMDLVGMSFVAAC